MFYTLWVNFDHVTSQLLMFKGFTFLLSSKLILYVFRTCQMINLRILNLVYKL